MKKICIDARMLNSGGIGSYIRTILQNFNNKAYKIFLLVNSKDVSKQKDLKKFNLIYFNAPIYSLKEQFLFFFKIPKCDLFFSPHFNVPIFPIRAKKRLVTIHDMFHMAFLSNFNFLERVYVRLIINIAVKISDKIITVSNFSKNEIMKFTTAKSKKIQVIHNAIDLEIFKKELDLNKIKTVKSKFDLPEKYFLFVGNLKPHKNIINILKAFEFFLKEHKDYSLVIVGSSKDLINSIDIKEILADRTELTSRVKIIDYVLLEDLPVIYQLAEAFVFPSYYEGFGFPPLEAMSVDCPVIASNAASLPEICKDAACYIDPYDVNDINKAMKKIIGEDFKKNLIEKGKIRVKFFSIENFIKGHLSQIESFL